MCECCNAERSIIMIELANRIKDCRSRLHLSQEYVASYMTMNRSTIAQIEGGKRKVTAEELVRFGALFGMSTDALVRGNEIEEPAALFTRSFNELDERDREEILSLMQFKKSMKEQRRKNGRI